MKPVVFLATARAELSASIRFYDSRRTGLGVQFLDSVEATIESILRHPDAGSPLPGGFLKRVVQGFPFSIIYRVEADGIFLSAVAHHHRRPDYWRNRKISS